MPDEEAPTEEKPKKKLSAGKKALIAIAVVVVLVFGGCIAALAVDDYMHAQYVPEGTMLDQRIDISGMTEAELRELIVNRVDNGIATSVCLDAGNKSYEFDMTDIGSIDIDAIVRQAFAPRSPGAIDRYAQRIKELITGEKPKYDVSIRCAVDDGMLTERVEAIAMDAECEMRNAGYAYDAGKNALVVMPAQQGVVLYREQTAKAIADAVGDVASSDPNRLVVKAPIEVTQPESFEAGQAIFVDTRGCVVRLYEDGKEVVNYPCTPGASGYETPKGDFYLWYKDPAPVWINPHSDWSKDMAETIDPGPTNPLGLRALAVSCGGGIFLHGTTNLGGLGRPGSHGCVRLSNDNIIDLYNRVSEGIPIIIR